jgi:signal recognition particle GTPase
LSAPQLVDIPKTRRKLNALLQENGLESHPGLIAGLQSLRSGRSSKNAYILLLGLTGAGKSTTVCNMKTVFNIFAWF